MICPSRKTIRKTNHHLQSISDNVGGNVVTTTGADGGTDEDDGDIWDDDVDYSGKVVPMWVLKIYVDMYMTTGCLGALLVHSGVPFT